MTLFHYQDSTIRILANNPGQVAIGWVGTKRDAGSNPIETTSMTIVIGWNKMGSNPIAHFERLHSITKIQLFEPFSILSFPVGKTEPTKKKCSRSELGWSIWALIYLWNRSSESVLHERCKLVIDDEWAHCLWVERPWWGFIALWISAWFDVT